MEITEHRVARRIRWRNFRADPFLGIQLPVSALRTLEAFLRHQCFYLDQRNIRGKLPQIVPGTENQDLLNVLEQCSYIISSTLRNFGLGRRQRGANGTKRR